MSYQPVGIPASWNLVVNSNGQDMYDWPRSHGGSYNLSPGTVSVNSAGNLVLTTSGEEGNYAGVTSPNSLIHGAFEARFKPEARDGKIANWPSFWLSGADWPTFGELDAFEGLSGEDVATYWYGSTVGGPATGLTTAASNGSNKTHVPTYGPGIPADGNFHTVGIYWTTWLIRIYNDGELFTEFTGSEIRAAPLHIMLDNTSGPSGLQPEGTPSDFEVEYVRVWSM